MKKLEYKEKYKDEKLKFLIFLLNIATVNVLAFLPMHIPTNIFFLDVVLNMLNKLPFFFFFFFFFFSFFLAASSAFGGFQA